MDFVQMDPQLFNGEHAEELSQIIWVISPTKSSGLLLRSTSSRCWACTRFGGYERLGIESVTSHGFCSDGPTTFQWLTCRRVITDHLSHSLQTLPAYCFVPHLPDTEPALDLVDMKGLVLNQLQVMDLVQMDPHLFNGEHAEELSQIIWVISLQNLPAYCFVPHLPDTEPALDLVDMKGLVLNQFQVMDFVQMDPQLFNG